jgi:hypothetical protein
MVEALIGEISSLTMEGRGDLISEWALLQMSMIPDRVEIPTREATLNEHSTGLEVCRIRSDCAVRRHAGDPESC